MNKCVSWCLCLFCFGGFFLCSACSVHNGKISDVSLAENLAAPSDNVLIFFNNPAFIATEYSVLSNKKSEVLSGRYSLKGECKSDTLYAVFLFTDKKEFPLYPGKTYTVSFDYRILKKGTQGFEVLFYSPTAAKNYESAAPLHINLEEGPEGRACLTSTLKNYDDYMIYWSIVKGGAIAIDNITVIEEDSNTVYCAFNIEAEKFVIDVNRQSIGEKVAHKTTVANFYPWMCSARHNLYDASDNPYSLVWTRRGLAREVESPLAMISGLESYRMQKDKTTLYLITPDWNIWTPSTQVLSSRSQFYLNESFKLNNTAEYPPKFMINFEHRDWNSLMAEKALNYKKAGFDGLMFDYWNNDAGNGRNKTRVENARVNLLKKIRKKVGDDFILMGNVNWNTEDPSASYLSGIFAELRKPCSARTYPISYADEHPEEGYFSIERLEDFLIHWDSVLQWPKVIAVEAWKRAENARILGDLTDHQNYETAKLLAAMTCVIPENGYFIYTDNHCDDRNSDHKHMYYNFYDTDFGKSLSHMRIVAEGVAYKEYERGYIAYNRTTHPITFTAADGTELFVNALEGVFVPK